MDQEHTNRSRFSTITLFISAISLALHCYILLNDDSKDVSISFLIFSHRYNFDRRDTIRRTWMKQVQNLPDVRVNFILGDKDCHIEATDLLDAYSCQAAPINMTRISSESLYRASNIATVDDSHSTHHGFSFKVRRGVKT